MVYPLSSVSTLSISFHRYRRIRNPFRRPKRRYTILGIITYELLTLSIIIFVFIQYESKETWIATIQLSFISVRYGSRVPYTLLVLPYYIIYLLAMALSCLTAYTLALLPRSNSKRDKENRSAAKRILVMNFSLTVWSVLMVVNEVFIETNVPGKELTVVLWMLYPRIYAVNNPIIFIITSGIRIGNLRQIFRRQSVGPSNSSGMGLTKVAPCTSRFSGSTSSNLTTQTSI